MKNKLLLLLIPGIYGLAAAQQPTWDFETWTGAGAGIEPSGWISENAAVLPPIYNNPQSVFQATSPDVHGGTYAMKITSVTMVANPAPGQLPDPVGLVATGVINISPPSLKFGFPFTARISTVSFWYKYTPVASDTAECLVSLWNGVTQDTLAIGYWKTGATISSYTQQNITLTYDPAFSTQFPDSMAIIFSSTKLFNPNYTLCMNCGKAGSNLWVDDITFSGWNGIAESPLPGNVGIYPNPASDMVNLTTDLENALSVSVHDMTGREVAAASMKPSYSPGRKQSHIPVSSFAAGLYSYSLKDVNGNILRSGKFNIAR